MKYRGLTRLALAAAHVIVLGGLAMPAPGYAAMHEQGGGQGADRMIERAFQDELGRAPREYEMRRYRRLVDREGWGERDIREDLRNRDDYRSSRQSDTSRRYSSWEVDKIIRRAYEDILGREADPAGLRLYRGRMLDEGWTEQQLRETLRDSPEAKGNSSTYADRMVKRAYQDVLGRDPDPTGLRTYRASILDDGWDEQDVRTALRRSPEYKQKQAALSDSEADDIVRRAYQNMLGRDPDPAAAAWKTRVLRDHWTQADVERELRKSDEYRNKQ